MRLWACRSLLLVLGGFACDQTTLVSSSTVPRSDAAVDAGATDAGLTVPFPLPDLPELDVEPNVVLGGSCVTEEQCDDGLDCTIDTCDEALQRCRHTGDNARCSDGTYCNGEEVCRVRLGCGAGPPTSCSDTTPCTIDRCDELTRQCLHVPRDVDGDGDPDGNCSPGSDCDDQDSTVSSLLPEVCGNRRDDNCDGQVDESDCDIPRFDLCSDALRVEQPGTFVLNPGGAGREHDTSCFLDDIDSAVDLVVEVVIPDGPDVDLVLTAQALGSRLAIADASDCEGGPSTGSCARGISLDSGLGVSRLRRSGLEAGSYRFAVFTDFRTPIELSVQWAVATQPLTPATCDEPRRVTLGVPFVVPVQLPEFELNDAGVQAVLLPSDCGEFSTNNIYEFELDTLSDVRVFSQSLDNFDNFGSSRVSLRSADCESLAAETLCSEGSLHPLTARRLSAGTYQIAFSADGPGNVEAVVDVSAPLPPPASEACSGAPPMGKNVSTAVSFESHIDDIEAGCVSGAVDAAFSLNLEETSDVLLVSRFSARDVGSVALASADCTSEQTAACTIGSNRPVRLVRRGVPPGEHRIVVESRLGLGATVVAAVRPAAAAVVVPGANSCDDVLTIPAISGAYQGSTLNATSEYAASCDFGSTSPAREQLLRVVLDQPKRMIVDARGSNFNVLLNLRRGPACPGTELAGGCSLSSGGVVSFLDLILEAGEYFLQIDGYAGDTGTWQLEAYFLEVR